MNVEWGIYTLERELGLGDMAGVNKASKIRDGGFVRTFHRTFHRERAQGRRRRADKGYYELGLPRMKKGRG